MITSVAGILLLLLYFFIFFMSAQNGDQSGSVSQKISEKCVEIINALTGGQWSKAFQESCAAYFEHPLRKLAHFGEYAVMGILAYTMLSQWMEQGRKLHSVTTLWVLLSAAADELHQYFVPGRYASVADVLLDTCGGICGMLLVKIIRNHLIQKRTCTS
ncbi:MAG: VanZ family protein [Acetatifactor sp.]